jgi:hypothetical protein
MARPGHDLQRLGTAQAGQGVLVELNDIEISATTINKVGA